MWPICLIDRQVAFIRRPKRSRFETFSKGKHNMGVVVCNGWDFCCLAVWSLDLYFQITAKMLLFFKCGEFSCCGEL